MSLIGTLDEIKLADVLKLFASGKKTGVLEVDAGKRRASLSLKNGHVVHAVAGKALGEEAVFDIFGWKQGQLTFVPGDEPVLPNVSTDVDSLIAEAVRIGDTFHRIRQVIPSDRVSFQMGLPPSDPEARVSLGATEWKVLRLLDGVRDVREVIEATRLPRDSVLGVLFELVEAGFLERVELQRALRVRPGKDQEVAEIDERAEREWTSVGRFAHGVVRIEVSGRAGRRAVLPVTFGQGLFRDVRLPKKVQTELRVREGEDVTVRPVA